MSKTRKWWEFRSTSITPPAPAESGSFSFNVDNPIANTPKYDLSAPYINRYGGNLYIPFGVDNLYPQILLDIYHSSPFHSSLVEFKARAIMADGLSFKTKGLTDLESQLLKGKLETTFNRNFIKELACEYIIHNRVYFEMNRKGEKSTNISLVPAETVRHINPDREDRPGFYINHDWRRRRADAEFVHKFDRYNTADKVQILGFWSKTPGVFSYPLPNYAAAANWLQLDADISFMQKQNLAHSLNPSAIINFFQDIRGAEEKQKFIDNLQESFSGARNSGKVMVFFSPGKELAPEVKMAEPNRLDRAFSGVQENIVKNVSYAHLINPALLGIATAGQLGNVTQMEDAFAIFRRIWLEPAQDDIEDMMNTLLKNAGYDATVKINRQSAFLPERANTENNDTHE